MSAPRLSERCLLLCYQGTQPQLPLFLQVVEMKTITPKTPQADASQKRYRAMVNDGQYVWSVMLATQLAEFVDQLTKGTIVQINEMLQNEIQGRKVSIVLKLNIVGFIESMIGPMIPVEGVADPMKQKPAQQEAPPYSSSMGMYGGAGGFQNGPPAYGKPPHAGGGMGQQQQQQHSSHVPPQPFGSAQSLSDSGFNQHGNGYNHMPQGGGGLGASNMGGGYSGPNQNGYGCDGPYGGGSMYGGGRGPGPAGPSYGRPHYGSSNQPIARNNAPATIIPIKALNPYSGRWVIQARCTSKSEMRRWSGIKGEGKLFSFDLLDREGGEIRATAFNDVAERCFPLVEVGKVYMLSKASLMHKKPQFNHTAHEFEIRLDRDTQVELCNEDEETSSIPEIQYHFKPLDSLEATEAGAIVDVIGIVDKVDDWVSIIRKTGDEVKKRSIVIRDTSARTIELTFWDKFVMEPGQALQEAFRNNERPVLAVKSVRVGDFNGKTLSTISNSSMKINPNIPEAAELRRWFDTQGASIAVMPLSERAGGGGIGRQDKRTTFSAIKDERLGTSGKPDWITVAGTISYIRHEHGQGVSYPACPQQVGGRTCQKKMMENMPGQWYCNQCNQPGEPIWRYLVQFQASDHTYTQWVTAFAEAGEQIFGMPAARMRELAETEPAEYDKRLQDANLQQMIFRLKVSEETYNDEVRIKASIQRLEKVDHVKEGMVLLDYIHKLENGIPVLMASSGPDAAGPATGYGGGSMPFPGSTMQPRASTSGYNSGPGAGTQMYSMGSSAAATTSYGQGYGPGSGRPGTMAAAAQPPLSRNMGGVGPPGNSYGGGDTPPTMRQGGGSMGPVGYGGGQQQQQQQGSARPTVGLPQYSQPAGPGSSIQHGSAAGYDAGPIAFGGGGMGGGMGGAGGAGGFGAGGGYGGGAGGGGYGGVGGGFGGAPGGGYGGTNMGNGNQYGNSGMGRPFM